MNAKDLSALILRFESEGGFIVPLTAPDGFLRTKRITRFIPYHCVLSIEEVEP